MSDLNEQAEAVRKMNDEQLGDLFELCHWVTREYWAPSGHVQITPTINGNEKRVPSYGFSTTGEIPDHIFRIAEDFIQNKQKELEANAQVKGK